MDFGHHIGHGGHLEIMNISFRSERRTYNQFKRIDAVF
jgi:hypothetical protein